MVEENLAKIPPMGKVVLEEHFTPQCDMPPEVVPPGQPRVDRITELLLIAKGRVTAGLAYGGSHKGGCENPYLVQRNHRLHIICGGLVSFFSPSELSYDLLRGGALFLLLLREGLFRAFKFTVDIRRWSR